MPKWSVFCNLVTHTFLFADARYPKMKLIEQKIPKKYKILHEYVVAKAALMRRHKEPPILKLDDLKQYVQ